MLPGQRDAVILDLIEQRGMATVAEIAARCNCAPETARRDLHRLEIRGVLQRTYGGGVRMGNSRATAGNGNGAGPLESRTALVDRADVLIVTPSETAATRLLVDRARRMGVPVVAESHNYPGANTVIAIDDYLAGVELGRWVADYARRHLNGRAQVLDVTAPMANTNARSRGFGDGLRDLPPADRAIYRVDGQGLCHTAFRIAADGLSVHPEINVIFGVNDDSALGALAAYRAAGLPEERLLVVSFGFEGQASKNLMEHGGPFKASVAMFPELVGHVCIKAAICAYHGCRLAERTFMPFTIITPENLDEYYHRSEDGVWEINWARGKQLLNANSSVALITQCHRHRLPNRIGCVQIFSSHEWYQNMQRAMHTLAQELGIAFEVVDASQDLVEEVEALKREIGYTAARYVNPGDTVIVDAGATTGYMAQALRGRHGIRVITSSLTVLATLDGELGIDLVSTGGVVNHASHSLIGSAAEATYGELRADTAFIGGAGISVDFGVSNSSITEAAIKQAMLKAARKVIVLADHTKIGLESLVKIAPISSIDTIITDAGLSAHDRAAFTQGGVDVIIAEEHP